MLPPKATSELKMHRIIFAARALSQIHLVYAPKAPSWINKSNLWSGGVNPPGSGYRQACGTSNFSYFCC